MEVFQEMVYKGCERSVITYSSLISACEKAGQWELALELFNEMHHEGCFPNTVTFNSLITACAQGGALQKTHKACSTEASDGRFSLAAKIVTLEAIHKLLRKDVRCAERSLSIAWLCYLSNQGETNLALLLHGKCGRLVSKQGKASRFRLYLMQVPSGRRPATFLRRCRARDARQTLSRTQP